jgi:hypothetical protein
MPTLRSHTHLQATQSQAQTKACKRLCLPNRTTDIPTDDREEQRRHNSNYPKGGDSYSKDSFVVKKQYFSASIFEVNITNAPIAKPL